MLCAVASQPLVSSSTTSNDLDDDADGRGYSNQIIFFFLISCTLPCVSGRERLFTFLGREKFTMRVKVSKRGMPKRKDNGKRFEPLIL